ncbi:MAG: biopolymer transporter ExbD [Myxococcota bacterium]
MRRNPFAKARAKRRSMPMTELSLAAMVDMMINILIFLLHLYGRGAVEAVPSEDLQLAKSTAEQEVRASISVVVSRQAILVGGATVLDLVDDHGVPTLPEGVVHEGHLPDLATALAAKRAKAEQQPLPEGRTYVPELLIETDRRVPWSVIGPVLRSGARAGVEHYRFVVSAQKREQP